MRTGRATRCGRCGARGRPAPCRGRKGRRPRGRRPRSGRTRPRPGAGGSLSPDHRRTLMPSTRFTEVVGCALPLQQAGMGGVAKADLAAAVSRAGALGMVGGAGVPTEGLQGIFDEIADRTSAPVGINFLMPFLDRSAVETAAANAKVVEFFYDDPDATLVDLVHAGGALAAWQVGSVDEARAAVQAGCDLVVAQGVEAGGHVRGEVALLPLLDGVLEVAGADVPVVASGRIGTA